MTDRIVLLRPVSADHGRVQLLDMRLAAAWAEVRNEAARIMDSPSVLAVTDAQIISKRTDTALHCVKWDETPRDIVLDGLRTFSLVSPDIAGLVMTMVSTGKSLSYGYKYGGYYGRYQNPYIDD